MTINQTRTVYSAQSFQAFVIHLADGREIPVQHPEFMAAAPSGRTIMIFGPDDSYNVIDLLLVTSLEVKPLISNGTGKRRKS